VVPRERFSVAAASLDSVRDHSPGDWPIVYVDGRSPARVRRHVQQVATQRGVTVVASKRYLTPNRARNLGFARVSTPYTIFLDNDVVVPPGALETLVRCADATGAAFVTPIYCIGAGDDDPVVHAAGGESRVVDGPDGPRLLDRHGFVHERLSQVRPQVRRERTDFTEFHCVLVRSEVLAMLGGLDDRYRAVFEHIDFTMQAATHGGGWLEPDSVVTYVPPPPFRLTDLPYYLLRWSKAWIDADFEAFAAKWRLHADDPGLAGNRTYLELHRRRILERERRAVRRVAGSRGLAWFDAAVDRLVTATLVRRYDDLTRGAPAPVHASPRPGAS
jgi:glycosyltransferase involved in cell wall biosynthesis